MKAPWIHSWLTSEITATDGTYRHRLLTENPNERDNALKGLSEAISAAHEDVRYHVRKLLDMDLDPVGQGDTDLLKGYPESLHPDTLKGYLGEILAGTVAENFDVIGFDDWEVPLYLFRFDSHALLHLGKIQGGAEPSPQPGRPGHDCLAFRRDIEGLVVGCLVCEGKCTGDHSSEMIVQGCEQLSDGARPNTLDLLRLIDALGDYDDEEASSWRRSLQFLVNGRVGDKYARHDFLFYLHGRGPKLKATWIGSRAPPKYSAARRFEAAELTLSDVESIVSACYTGNDNGD